MLRFYQRWALRLSRFKFLFLMFFLASIATFVWLLFSADTPQSERWLLSSVVLAVSWLLLWLCATVFSDLPSAVAPEQRLLLRVKLRLQRAGYYLLAIIVTLLLFFIAYLGVRAITGIIAPLIFS